MKYKILLILVITLSLNVSAQSVNREQFNDLQKKLQKEKDKAKQADILYQGARYYLEKEGKFKTDLDSASLLNSRSLNISKQLDLKKSIVLSMLLDGEIAMKKGNNTLAAKLKSSALDYTLKYSLKKEGAAVYTSMAMDVPENDTPKKEEYFLKSASLYKQAGAFYDEAEVYNNLSILYNGIDEPAISIKYAKEAIKIKKRIKRHDLYQEYTMLALNYRIQGNYQNALSYALAAEKLTENTEVDGQWLSVLYNILGTIYSEMKFYDKSVEYYHKAIAIAKENNDTEGVTSITINTARGLYNRGKAAEALEILDSGYKYYHGEDCNVDYPALYILIYSTLKKYDKARPYYEQLLKCSNKEGSAGYIDHIQQEKMYYAMIRFLVKTGQAEKTYIYIERLKKLAKKNNDLYNLSQLEKTHFESDSATGNYLGAIQHFKDHKILNDSLFNINRTKQFADLQLKYETDKKDKNIKLLTQKSQLQQTRIEYEVFIRYIFIGSLVILSVILGLLYNRYCMKRKTNTILEAKQEEINRQNKKLQLLVDEKEWLVKEIHHRVKNNLQIVISLLNTQSAYLENEDALQAIQNSQHRMHAMSLIHQKLYQTENLSSINMSWYITELAEYLKDSFDNDDNIKFKLSLSPIDLDVAQAVPLGLILNEAISNSIKYAFPERKGIISVLFEERENKYLLRIADNGSGLPDDFAAAERDSLGMNLMMGLAEQLDGTFNITSDNGVIITINFIKKEASV